MPKHCPAPSVIIAALHKSVPHVYGQTIGPALNCTYYLNGDKKSPGVNITFGNSGVSDPAGAAAAWKAHLSAFHSAQTVSGIGDGAVYYIASNDVTAFNFISNGFTCNMYTGNFKATKAQLADLAGAILQGRG